MRILLPDTTKMLRVEFSKGEGCYLQIIQDFCALVTLELLGKLGVGGAKPRAQSLGRESLNEEEAVVGL